MMLSESSYYVSNNKNKNRELNQTCRILSMSDSSDTGIPLLLWPFYAMWRLLTFILSIVGRLLCAILGIGLMGAGVVITMSLVGAPIGIPLAAFGFLLLIRALF
jgi:hypothetical protein